MVEGGKRCPLSVSAELSLASRRVEYAVCAGNDDDHDGSISSTPRYFDGSWATAAKILRNFPYLTSSSLPRRTFDTLETRVGMVLKVVATGM